MAKSYEDALYSSSGREKDSASGKGVFSRAKEYFAPTDPADYKYGSSAHPVSEKKDTKAATKESAPASAPAKAKTSSGKSPVHRSYEDPGEISSGPDKRTIAADRALAAKTKKSKAALEKAKKSTAETSSNTRRTGGVLPDSNKGADRKTTFEEKKATPASKSMMRTQSKRRPSRLRRIAGGVGRAVGRGLSYAVKGPKKKPSVKLSV